jgi:hypothetical protein
MRILAYVGVALWVGVGIVIAVWNFILSAQMMNHRVPKPWPILGSRRFSFQTDPADYTAVGQQYRQKIDPGRDRLARVCAQPRSSHFGGKLGVRPSQQRAGWVELLRNPSLTSDVSMGFAVRSTHPAY